MKFYEKSAEEVVKELSSDAHAGLTSGQVQENAEKYGRNVFSETKKKSLLRRIWEAATEPMLVLLFFAWIITLSLIHISEPTRP